MKKLINILFAIVLSMSLHAQQVAKSMSGSFLLKGATVHTITNGDVNADVLIEGGMIKTIAPSISPASGTEVIDCSGKHIYPGMIDGGSHAGLSEVSSISLTNDFNEVGDFNPHVQALTAVNPNSVIIPVTRVNGVTQVLAKPSGGIVSGTAALISMHGYTPDQMYAGFKGMVMNWPGTGRRGWWDNRSDEEIEKAAKETMKSIDDIWEKASTYAKMNAEEEVTEYNPEMKALMPVVNGDMPLMIEVNKEDDITAVLKWVKEKENLNVILTGVSEGYRVADKIAEAGIPVITGPILARPSRNSDRYDAAYSNAGQMHKAGVKVAIRTDETENTRNLPFHAGFAAAYGMGKEAALKAVTIVPAELFGVADKYGSIEEGKMGSLFVSDGDPFETKTNIHHLFIDGWKVPLESRHTLLYEEFLNRDPGLQK